MNQPDIAKRLITLRNKDVAMRKELARQGKLGPGYHPEMQRLHNDNADALSLIIQDIGYPTTARVGKEGSDAAWLIVQHAIAKPAFMRQCAISLARETGVTTAERINLAYLTDRIAFFEAKPQRFGTQFDWNENGKLSPHTLDDVTLVNERRRSLGLNSVGEQTTLLRERAQAENQSAPDDFRERKREMDEWRLVVGWTTKSQGPKPV